MVIKDLRSVKHNLDIEDYKNQELIYILKEIAEEFVKDFYKGII